MLGSYSRVFTLITKGLSYYLKLKVFLDGWWLQIKISAGARAIKAGKSIS